MENIEIQELGKKIRQHQELINVKEALEEKLLKQETSHQLIRLKIIYQIEQLERTVKILKKEILDSIAWDEIDWGVIPSLH